MPIPALDDFEVVMKQIVEQLNGNSAKPWPAKEQPKCPEAPKASADPQT